MGYTHYWRCSNPHALAKHSNFEECLGSMNKVIRSKHHGVDLDVDFGKFIFFNGVEEDGHETFVFPPNSDFDFCKTAQKPYDVVVTACLTIAKHYLRDAIEVSSDGNASDWTKGVELASKVLGFELKNPIE